MIIVLMILQTNFQNIKIKSNNHKHMRFFWLNKEDEKNINQQLPHTCRYENNATPLTHSISSESSSNNAVLTLAENSFFER